MASSFRLFSAPTRLTHVLNTSFRLSSTDAATEARRKWHLGGVPSPRSILEDDTVNVDLSEDNDLVNGLNPNTPPSHLRRPPDKPTPQEWRAHRQTIKKEFPDGWSPPHKLSREAMDGLRKLHRFDPQKFTTPVLAEKFRISPEAVRRILKSKWEPPRGKTAKLLETERILRAERAEEKGRMKIKERLEMQQVVALQKDQKFTFR
ncbi:hypothetical protein BDQ17DRAFT_1299864 [Cyathus striatus]|nr:hypothetical protein BDQ17DRAFT_1299864 [Cyathus striatus]